MGQGHGSWVMGMRKSGVPSCYTCSNRHEKKVRAKYEAVREGRRGRVIAGVTGQEAWQIIETIPDEGKVVVDGVNITTAPASGGNALLRTEQD